MPDLTILYRGPLSSCNYDCHYCPFAKHHETSQELMHDRKCLERFVRWAADDWPMRATGQTSGELSIFFTPWGEALVRPWYQKSIAQLTRLPHIRKVAIQTNLACRLDWISDCDLHRLGLWCTFHPSQTTRHQFLAQCLALDDLGVRFSVGAVGLLEDLDEISQLRRELPSRIYLWINAYKDQPNYYTEIDLQRWEQIDSLFRINTVRHPSKGHRCRTGVSVISVNGEGEITRCHFVKERLGNLYDSSLIEVLAERPCPNDTCGCHIGYVHLDRLNLKPVFGEGLLERIPTPNHPRHEMETL